MTIQILAATISDIPAMVVLSCLKRKAYEQAQPIFWKYKEGAEKAQEAWFTELLSDDRYIMLVASAHHHEELQACEAGRGDPKNINKKMDCRVGQWPPRKDGIEGFIIGKVIPAPEVYDPGGLTLMIDDFCVKDDNWQDMGVKLIDQIKLIAQDKGVTQLVVVSGDHDGTKCLFLEQIGLSVASRWYVGEAK